jgi:hypothetical protein
LLISAYFFLNKPKPVFDLELRSAHILACMRHIRVATIFSAHAPRPIFLIALQSVHDAPRCNFLIIPIPAENC